MIPSFRRAAEVSMARVEKKTCRGCSGELETVLDLGSLKLNAFPATRAEGAEVPTVPLVLMRCLECGLIQLDRTVPADLMYREYWYLSGVNESMVAELKSVVQDACSRVDLTKGDRILDIGANDGTLLSHYRECADVEDLHRVAVEPARNLAQSLLQHCDELHTDYYPTSALGTQAQFQIITAIACAYDTEDPIAFFQSIRGHLAPEGVAIIQFQDFGQQLEAAAFDNICHEHLEYFTLWSLVALVNRCGLRVQACTQRKINGGSLRVVLKHLGSAGEPELSVGSQLVWEMQRGLDTPTLRAAHPVVFQRFRDQVRRAQEHIQTFLQMTRGLTLDVYGASTKGNILLQVLGVGSGEVRQAIDRSPAKWGRYTITGIPIVSEQVGREQPADVWLCPIWQFKESVLKRERWYLREGGTIAFPLPVLEVVKETY